ncbi:hypothetical protein L0U88_10230 [Flavihumibacter sp. RY-1]|jgi:hypothetical protein|uniref:Outer membrane protein beta-barrel domain-containing protein n=1 Tax=Flavihumibacter fluminis TaxID=2909236 RepID=A0ABS9BH23_9BACT|nr:hypothetical protein [Flavihumibacter fluminis]MCF1715002.1 hypothetical protein [Flavihumibacter fluminis]
MKKLLLSFAMAAGLMSAKAQSDYNSAIGLRIGGYDDLVSASYKTHVTKPGALEFNLGFRGRSYGSFDWVTVAFSAAYQHHFEIKPVPGLRWFVGGGLTAYNSFSNYDDYKGFGLGIFPTGGIDYKFEKIPLNLSADVRPTFGIVDPYDAPGYKHRNFRGDNFGISARYTFR